MKWLVAILSISLSLSACGDEGTSDADAASAGNVADADPLAPDAMPLPLDAAMGAGDAGTRVDAAISVDAASVNLGPVDCASNTDCSFVGGSCNVSAPGGICIGCVPGGCGTGFECRFGACVRDCTVDDDCSAGKRCTPGGACVIRTCSDQSPCPAPYICNDTLVQGLCNRPSCSGGTCPAGMSCDLPSDTCVEI